VGHLTMIKGRRCSSEGKWLMLMGLQLGVLMVVFVFSMIQR
jgi:hypothetical protein